MTRTRHKDAAAVLLAGCSAARPRTDQILPFRGPCIFVAFYGRLSTSSLCASSTRHGGGGRQEARNKTRSGQRREARDAVSVEKGEGNSSRANDAEQCGLQDAKEPHSDRLFFSFICGFFTKLGLFEVEKPLLSRIIFFYLASSCSCLILDTETCSPCKLVPSTVQALEQETKNETKKTKTTKRNKKATEYNT